ncbi:nuclear transport factor 2 family protein [Streptomyces sp. NPDC001177]
MTATPLAADGYTQTETANRDVITALYADLAAGEIPAFLAHLDPAIEWTVAAGSQTGGIYHGGQEVLEKALAPLSVVWDDFQLTPYELCPVGDKVFVIGEYRGIHKETRKVGAARFVHIWQMRGGLAHRFETVFDTHTIWQATQ